MITIFKVYSKQKRAMIDADGNYFEIEYWVEEAALLTKRSAVARLYELNPEGAFKIQKEYIN